MTPSLRSSLLPRIPALAVAAVAEERAAAEASSSSSQFWQRLIAAELPYHRLRGLLNELGGDFPVWAALMAVPTLSSHEREKLEATGDRGVLAAMDQGGFVLAGSALPTGLKELAEPPFAIFGQGVADVLHRPCVGIVGTRNASTYGRGVAKKFGETLARSGITVVSGGALGIDAAAHEGALQAGGATAAVLAGGIDLPYPRSHIGMFRRVAEVGCVLSTYAFGIQPNPFRFLARNSIIAGLCQAIIVIEAPAQSGALSTAATMRRLGRPVFVVPANIENLKFQGSHLLIRRGATLIDDPLQVINELNLSPVLPFFEEPELSKVGKQLFDLMTTSPQSAERLSELTGIEASEALGELTMLELDGLIWRDGGGYARYP